MSRPFDLSLPWRTESVSDITISGRCEATIKKAGQLKHQHMREYAGINSYRIYSHVLTNQSAKLEPWACSTMKSLQTILLLRDTIVLPQHWRKHFPIAVLPVGGFQLQASMRSAQTAILMRNRKWLSQRLKVEPWRDKSTSQVSRETTFPGFTLLRQENCISLRWWRYMKGKTSTMMKRKSFCRLKVVSHVTQVVWAENRFILWRQTSRRVQAWTTLISLNIGGAPLFKNSVTARGGHLVSAGKPCCYHPCPSHLQSHGCGVESSRVQKMPKVI